MAERYSSFSPSSVAEPANSDLAISKKQDIELFYPSMYALSLLLEHCFLHFSHCINGLQLYESRALLVFSISLLRR